MLEKGGPLCVDIVDDVLSVYYDFGGVVLPFVGIDDGLTDTFLLKVCPPLLDSSKYFCANKSDIIDMFLDLLIDLSLALEL